MPSGLPLKREVSFLLIQADPASRRGLIQVLYVVMQPRVSGLRLAGLLVQPGRFGKRRLRDGRREGGCVGVFWPLRIRGRSMRFAAPLGKATHCLPLGWLSLASLTQSAAALGVGFGLAPDV